MEAFNYEESKTKYMQTVQKIHKTKYYPYDEKAKDKFISFVKAKKNPYYMKYDVIKDSTNVELLILKRRLPDVPIVEVLPAATSKCFDIMAEVHLLEHHTLCAKMGAILQKVYYIPPYIMTIFEKSCNLCYSLHTAGVTNPKVLSVKYIIPEYTVLCAIFKLQADPDHGFSHIVVYIDALTSYLLIRPVYSNSLRVVSYELLKIFLDFGLPENILNDSDSEINFKTIMEILKCTGIFPHLPIVHKKNEYRLNWALETITLLMKSWIMRNSPNWAIGLKEAQWQLNNLSDYKMLKSRKILNSDIKSPYHAHFGSLPCDNVIQRSKESLRTGDAKKSKKTHMHIKTFELNCLKCGEQVSEMFYKTCVICKRKCHFDCCVIDVVESLTLCDRTLQATCYPCVAKKKILEKYQKNND